MKLLPGFLTEEDAMAMSASLYGSPQGGATLYLVDWKQHPQTQEWALCVPQDYEYRILQGFRVNLVEDDWPQSEVLPNLIE